mgnify:CR=1 FL=1
MRIRIRLGGRLLRLGSMGLRIWFGMISWRFNGGGGMEIRIKLILKDI